MRERRIWLCLTRRRINPSTFRRQFGQNPPAPARPKHAALAPVLRHGHPRDTHPVGFATPSLERRLSPSLLARAFEQSRRRDGLQLHQARRPMDRPPQSDRYPASRRRLQPGDVHRVHQAGWLAPNPRFRILATHPIPARARLAHRGIAPRSRPDGRRRPDPAAPAHQPRRPWDHRTTPERVDAPLACRVPIPRSHAQTRLLDGDPNRTPLIGALLDRVHRCVAD